MAGVQYIPPYKMRKIFKMRDPYAVLVARQWARDMGILECMLVLLTSFALFSISWEKNPPWGVYRDGDDYVADDDKIRIGKLQLTGHIYFKDSAQWAVFALVPWVHKGLLIIFDIMAVWCSCQGNCLAATHKHHFCCCDEKMIFKTMGCCTSASAACTTLGALLTTVTLFFKWKRALFASNGEINSTLLFMSLYGILTLILLGLRASAARRAFHARTVLQEEVVAV